MTSSDLRPTGPYLRPTGPYLRHTGAALATIAIVCAATSGLAQAQPARAAVTRQTWAGMQSGALARDQAQSEYDVIAAIEGWGRTSNVELGSIKPVWKHGANDSYSLLECRLDASGTLPALTRFMYELGRSPLALRADSVELASRDDTGDILTLGLTITGLRLAPLEEKK